MNKNSMSQYELRTKNSKKLMVVINLAFFHSSLCTGNPIFLSSLCMEITEVSKWMNINSKFKMPNFQYMTYLTHLHQQLPLYDYKPVKQLPTMVVSVFLYMWVETTTLTHIGSKRFSYVRGETTTLTLNGTMCFIRI